MYWLGEEFHLSELQPVVAEIGSGLEIERATVFCPEDVADASLLLSKRAMELVLWELLENAKKFHPTQDPTVGILVSRASSREISLQVRDDGLTVSPEHLGKFWTPFYQGEKDFTGEVPGMGLGLSTVAMLVWEVGGTCCAYNREDGPGIVIDLTLPSNEETGASNRPSLAT
jgi:K+-sensing histidine kinase KdpD